MSGDAAEGNTHVDVRAGTLVWRTLRPIAIAFAVFLAWTAWREWQEMTGPARGPVVGADVAAAALLAAASVVLFSKPVRPNLAHPLAMLVALSITSTHLVSVAVQDNGAALIEGTFILIGQAMVMMSMGWFLALLAIEIAAWAAVIGGAGVAVPGYVGFSLQVAVVLSTGVQYGRVRSYRALIAARDKEAAERAAAESARDELAQFANAVAHDLRSPLGTVRLKAALLARHEDSKVQKVADDLDRIADGSATFIEGLLQYAHAGQAAKRKPVDLESIIAAAEQLSHADVPIERDSLPTVTGDPALLQQLALNLINNACAYRHPDRQLRMLITHRLAGQQHEIRFSDNGIGIESPDPDRLFKPFQRGTDVGNGHGMGLATCARIVQAHGGAISVEKRPIGACFLITLPAAARFDGAADSLPPDAGNVDATSTTRGTTATDSHGDTAAAPVTPVRRDDD